jgi:hypothetical protein
VLSLNQEVNVELNLRPEEIVLSYFLFVLTSLELPAFFGVVLLKILSA